MRIVIIDYGAGNVRSAEKAFARAAAAFEGAQVVLSGDAATVRQADRVVLPGQGSFADCMAGLKALPGMVETLHEVVLKKARPFLGICVGMQLLASHGREHGSHQGLGWVGGVVDKMQPGAANLKIPHMGWNQLQHKADHPLLHHLPESVYVYFVHSYALALENPRHQLAACDYGGLFTAAVVKDNIAGIQFHPEKSQRIGLQLIHNFLDWKP